MAREEPWGLARQATEGTKESAIGLGGHGGQRRGELSQAEWDSLLLPHCR